MNVEEAFEEIEGVEFGAAVGVASSLKVFLGIVASCSAVKTLLEAVRQPGVPDVVPRRITTLLAKEPENGYEHPDDTALAAYLWVLGEQRPDCAEIAACEIHNGLRLHWARMLAEAFLANRVRQPAANL
jgi:hypothetical protein